MTNVAPEGEGASSRRTWPQEPAPYSSIGDDPTPGLAEALVETVNTLSSSIVDRVRSKPPMAPLRPDEVALLRLVGLREACEVGQAARELRRSESTVSAVATRLIVAGLLDRTSEGHEPGRARLWVTATGRERLEAWRSRRTALVSEALASLSPIERCMVADALPLMLQLGAAMEPDDPAEGER
jgi:DNA-binding MarR family transcriptional regulator